MSKPFSIKNLIKEYGRDAVYIYLHINKNITCWSDLAWTLCVEVDGHEIWEDGLSSYYTKRGLQDYIRDKYDFKGVHVNHLVIE